MQWWERIAIVRQQAEAVWGRFFAALDSNLEPDFLAASRGELLYDYITTQLRLGLEPAHRNRLRAHRLEIIGHHQRLLEQTADERLERLEGVSSWMTSNLGQPR